MADWKLLIEDDAGQTITVPLFRDIITIGRKEGNTIRLTERNVSRFHAKILRDNSTVFVEDLQSYTGVKLNGDRIKGRIEVREGDLIEIGDYHLELQREGAEAGAHPSLNEPTQRLTPSPAARVEPEEPAEAPADETGDEDDEFAGDTQRWEPPVGMEPVPVGLPTIQDQAPISGVDVLGDPATVDEAMSFQPPTLRRSEVETDDPDETLRQDLAGMPMAVTLPTTTDPFAAVEAEAVLAEMTNDEVLSLPGGPDDAGLLAAMTEQLPNPVALLDSQPSEAPITPKQNAVEPAPAMSPEATPVPSSPPPRTSTGMPPPRAIAVEKNLPPVLEGPTEDTQALTRSPGPSEDVHIDKARLVALNTVFAGVVFPIVRLETVIGRVEENDLVIEHRSVSRSHAKIVREGNRYRIVDLKSANGILVNGLEVESHVLRPGDVLELGRVKLRFVPAGERFQLSPAEIERARIADVQGPDDFADETATGVVSSVALGAYPPPPSAQGMQRSTMIIAALGVTVLILAVVLVVMLMGGRGGDDASTATPTGDVNKGSVERALLLEKAGDLKAAADMLSVLAAEGDDAARSSLTRVEQGIANQARVRELQSHIDAKRYRDAVELAPSINTDAPYADEAKAKVELARVTGADLAFGVATKALDDGVAAAAEDAVANLAFFEPDSERTRGAKARLKSMHDKSGSKADPPPDDGTRNAGRADRPETRPPEKREVKTSPAAKEKDKDDRKLQPVVDTAAAAKLHQEARGLLLKNKFSSVILTLNEALKKDPGYADAYREMGTAFKSLGERKKAIQNYRTYLNMRPRAPDASTVRNWTEELEREAAAP
jgi:pSer/pThr/pTyr-binding forkhead associated (FHA) protein/tetratricopeptide (TPR) repeat protein